MKRFAQLSVATLSILITGHSSLITVMTQTQEPIWVVNVAEGTTKGNYRGVNVKVKNMITHQEIYLDGNFHSNAETKSPVKAVNAAMEAIDKQLNL